MLLLSLLQLLILVVVIIIIIHRMREKILPTYLLYAINDNKEERKHGQEILFYCVTSQKKNGRSNQVGCFSFKTHSSVPAAALHPH